MAKMHDDDGMEPTSEMVPAFGILKALEGKPPLKVVYHTKREEFFLVTETDEPCERTAFHTVLVPYKILGLFDGNQDGHDLAKRAARSREMQDVLHGQARRLGALIHDNPDLAPDLLAALGDVARELLETSELPDGVPVEQAGGE